MISREQRPPVTRRALWLLFGIAESAIVLGAAAMLLSDASPIDALKLFLLGTAGISIFVFVLMFAFTGGRARMLKIYPYLAWFVGIYALIQLLLFLKSR